MLLKEKSCRIYEQLAAHDLEGDPIRPGGLALTQRAIRLSPLARGATVLDIGCGTGAALHYLSGSCGFRALGIDPSARLLALGCRSEGLCEGTQRIRATGEELPLAAGVCDGILAECSLSVTRDVLRVLGECRRVLKSKGVLLVSDVYARNPEGAPQLGALPLECCLTGTVSREEWLSRLAAGGFAVTLWEDHSGALKEFAARLILSHGSLEGFWCRSTQQSGQKVDPGAVQSALSRARPGYFLMIAHKAE